MKVLLLGGIPDPLRDAEWYSVTDVVGVREAALGLCRAAKAAGGTLCVLRHVLEFQPGFAAFLRASLPEERIVPVDDLEAPGALEGVTHVVFLAGTDREITVARKLRAAGARVFPVGSTGAAADMLLAEAVINESWGLTPVDCVVLARDTVYAVLFEKILSL